MKHPLDKEFESYDLPYYILLHYNILLHTILSFSHHLYFLSLFIQRIHNTHQYTMLIALYTLLTLCNTFHIFPSSMPNYSFIIILCNFLFSQYFQSSTVLYLIPLINFIACFCCQNLYPFPLCAVSHICHPKPPHDAVFTPIHLSQNPHFSTCPLQHNVTCYGPMF